MNANKFEGFNKEFSQLSRTWYGSAYLSKEKGLLDIVNFGFYSSEGGTTGAMSMRWVNIGGEITPKLTVHDDAWGALSKLHDLIDALSEYDSMNITPAKFCEILLRCGFVDNTEVEVTITMQ